MLCNGMINKGLKPSEKVITFKSVLIDNINKLIPSSAVLNSTDIETLLCDHKYIDVIYTGVGHNQDMIININIKNEITINYIYGERS